MAEVLEEVDDWERLAGLLNITGCATDNINKNCASFGRAECQWKELVKTYCDTIPSDDSYEAASDIARKLREMQHPKEAKRMEELHFCTVTTGKFCTGNVPGYFNHLW